MAITEQERQRRSEQARRMHREGKLGNAAAARNGAARSAEVRSARASSIARRLLEEHEDEVRKTLMDVLAKGSRSEKLKAVDLMVKAGLRGESVGLAEQRIEGEQRSREELIAAIMMKLQAPTPAAAIMRAELGTRGVVVDGTATEITP